MRISFLKAFLPWMLGFLFLASCDRKPDPSALEASFVVNGHTGDSRLSPSADAQTLRFEVYSEKAWTVREEGIPSDWIQYESEKSSKKNSWTFSLQLSENVSSSSRPAVLVFASGELERRVSVVQSIEDPIFRVHTLGAYGVPGGDWVYQEERFQTGRLLYGEDRMSFRIVEPGAVRVMLLSGMPHSMEPGMHFPVFFRVVDHGYTRCSSYYDVQVIRVRDSLTWLKNDDQTYFVISQ